MVSPRRRSSLLLALPLLLACVAEPTRPEGSYGPLQLDARFEREALANGDSTWLVVSVHNPTDTSITVPFNSGCQLLPFIDRLDPRQPWHPTTNGYACTGGLTALRIGPGDRYEERLLVRGRLDVAPPTYNTPGISLTPGRYEGYAVLNVDGTGGRSGPRSAAATIDVRP